VSSRNSIRLVPGRLYKAKDLPVVLEQSHYVERYDENFAEHPFAVSVKMTCGDTAMYIKSFSYFLSHWECSTEGQYEVKTQHTCDVFLYGDTLIQIQATHDVLEPS